jgi:hypothetical protein
VFHTQLVLLDISTHIKFSRIFPVFCFLLKDEVASSEARFLHLLELGIFDTNNVFFVFFEEGILNILNEHLLA